MYHSVLMYTFAFSLTSPLSEVIQHRLGPQRKDFGIAVAGFYRSETLTGCAKVFLKSCNFLNCCNKNTVKKSCATILVLEKKT